MNRLEEYNHLLDELNQPVPGLNTSLDRAIKRKKRKDLFYRPLIGAAASFLLFVFLVNVSGTVAKACSKVPILKELAEAVTFSRSLKNAVEHNYVQELNLTQTDGNVTATIEYLIVDQKQINVFYRLDSTAYQFMEGQPELLSCDTGEKLPCSTYWSRGNEPANGKLLHFTADFSAEDVPDQINLNLTVVHYPIMEDKSRPDDSEIFSVKNTVADFTFLLEFDPTFTDAGKEILVDQEINMDGQKIRITNLTIYPSHIRIDVEDSLDNTAWLKNLNFYLVADGTEKFESISNGVSATGDIDSKAMASFRADSSYFYNADTLELVITGATWLDKDKEKAYINLEKEETDNLPEGVQLYHVEKQSEGWNVSIRVPFVKKDHYYQTFGSTFYDAQGKEYSSVRWSTEGDYGDYGNEVSPETHFIESRELTDYHGKEVWISLEYSHRWETETPIHVQIALD